MRFKVLTNRLRNCWWTNSVFIVVSGASILILSMFLVWMAIDAQYQPTLNSVPYHLRLNQSVPAGIGDAELFQRMLAVERRWHRQGPRLLLLSFLSGSAFVTSSLAVGLFIFCRTGRRAFVIVVLTLSWTVFLTSHAYLDHYFFCQRASSLLPRCQMAAESLSRNWPTENGTLSGVGGFRVGRGRISNYLSLELKPPYLCQESIGYSIERSGNGSIHFDLLARPGWEIVFHPQDRILDSYTSSWGHTLRLLRARKLKDQWFLVEYEFVPQSSRKEH